MVMAEREEETVTRPVHIRLFVLMQTGVIVLYLLWIDILYYMLSFRRCQGKCLLVNNLFTFGRSNFGLLGHDDSRDNIG